MSTQLIDLITQFRCATNEHFPYLSSYIYSLTPVERPGIGTMAVDKYGKLYYDPAFCERITLEQGAYVVLHEATHLILRHCHRSEGIIGSTPTQRERYLLNVAMDIVVWEFLEAIAKDCPEEGVTFDKAKEKYPAIERNMTAEELYSIISEQDRKDDEKARKDPFDPDQKEGEGDDQEDAEQEEDESGEEDGTSEQEGDGEETDDADGEGEDSDTPIRGDGFGGQHDGANKPGNAEGDAEDSGKPGDFEMIGGGSAADGLDRDYEEEPDPKWDAFVEDRLLEAVEKKIEEIENDYEWRSGRGTIPAELKRVIKKKLHPKPNPWDRLRATVSKAAANPKGYPDYTYRRPNRRQQGGDIRLKGMQKYCPKAAVVIDTSGSMTSACLAKALNVVKQGLRALGQVPVVTCDARVGMDKVLTSVHDDFEFVGGGGTDMRIPLAHVEEKYRPDVVVIVTDTDTPWPDKKMKAQLIVAATQDGRVPEWAIKVRIPDDPTKEELDDDQN